MEKSLKSITQYATNDVISLQNVIALQVYNHGDLPLKINGIVIMPKETFPLVTPDGSLAENYQVTPEFFDKSRITFDFPKIDAKSLATEPKFTLLSSVFDLNGAKEKVFRGSLTNHLFTEKRNDFNGTNEIPNMVQAFDGIFEFTLEDYDGEKLDCNSFDVFVGLPNEKKYTYTIIRDEFAITLKCYDSQLGVYLKAGFQNTSFMVIKNNF